MHQFYLVQNPDNNINITATYCSQGVTGNPCHPTNLTQQNSYWTTEITGDPFFVPILWTICVDAEGAGNYNCECLSNLTLTEAFLPCVVSDGTGASAVNYIQSLDPSTLIPYTQHWTTIHTSNFNGPNFTVTGNTDLSVSDPSSGTTAGDDMTNGLSKATGVDASRIGYSVTNAGSKRATGTTLNMWVADGTNPTTFGPQSTNSMAGEVQTFFPLLLSLFVLLVIQ